MTRIKTVMTAFAQAIRFHETPAPSHAGQGDGARFLPPDTPSPHYRNHAEEIEAARRADEIARKGQRP